MSESFIMSGPTDFHSLRPAELCPSSQVEMIGLAAHTISPSGAPKSRQRFLTPSSADILSRSQGKWKSTDSPDSRFTVKPLSQCRIRRTSCLFSTQPEERRQTDVNHQKLNSSDFTLSLLLLHTTQREKTFSPTVVPLLCLLRLHNRRELHNLQQE